MEKTLKFTKQYREQVRLRNGSRVLVRLVRPSDKAHIQNGFLNLSAHSRYKRFFGGKNSLSDSELSYFTELNQYDHFGLGAVELNEYGEEEDGIGIGRFVRMSGDSECAEVALTVIDRMQGNGIGQMLLEKLIAAAAERNIKRFRFECLPNNFEMQKLAYKVCQVASFRNDDGTLIVEADLPNRQPDSKARSIHPLTSLFDLLHAFTAKSLELQFGIGLGVIQHTLDTAFDRRST